jgi:hypothetical protein
MFGPHHIRGHILSSLVKPDKKSPRRQMGHPHGQRRVKSNNHQINQQHR